MTERSRATHETMAGDNPPTADQLFRLASHGMASARKTNTRRTGRLNPRAHTGIQEIEWTNDAAEAVSFNYPSRMRRRVAIRIGRQTLGNIPVREWSLRIYDTNWYEQPSGLWTGIRDIYRFDWDQDSTTLAERKTKFVPTQQDRTLYDELEHFTISQDMAEIFHIEQEMAQVTAGDTEQLIADVADFYTHDDLFMYRRASS